MTIYYFKEIQYLRKTHKMFYVSAISFCVFLLYAVTFFQHIDLIAEIFPEITNYILLRITQIVSVVFLYILIKSYFYKLETKLTKSGVIFRMIPFVNKNRQIKIDSINKVEVIKNRKLKQFSGWGMRNGKMRNIFVITGTKGIRIELKDGKRIILGSQKPELFIKAFEKIKKKK